MNKKILLLGLILGLCFNNLVCAQQSDSITTNNGTHRKVVNVIEPQKFHLNSRGKASINGQSKVSVLIKLPKNTIEWFYSIIASNDNNTSGIELAAQMTILMVKPFAQVNQIKVSQGNSYCDVFLFSDKAELSKFNNGEAFKYNSLYSRTGFTSGTIKCTDISEFQWIGIRNQRTIHSVDVMLEVVAIVEE